MWFLPDYTQPIHLVSSVCTRLQFGLKLHDSFVAGSPYVFTKQVSNGRLPAASLIDTVHQRGLSRCGSAMHSHEADFVLVLFKASIRPGFERNNSSKRKLQNAIKFNFM